MTSTITLTSQLNTLLEQQASIIQSAERFANNLKNTTMKELKEIASNWKVTPENKTKKAYYIAALQRNQAEGNGLTEVTEQIEKLQFQIKCAEAQECANAQQKVIRVIRTIEQTWWVGTEETFHTIYPNEGYEIHFTARPEKPDTYSLTSNPAILMQDVKIDGTTYTVYGHDREELEQDTIVLTEAVQQTQKETLYDRIHEGESVNVKTAQGVHFTIQPSYWEGVRLGYTVIQNGEIVPGYKDMMLETDMAKDWLAGLEEDIPETPLQGVASFFSSLAVFSAHDVLPFDVIGDIELYEQLKSQWDAMNGDEKCQCDWCDAEPLQYQEQEELQFAEKQEDPQKLLEEYNHLFAQKGDAFRSIEIVSSLSDQGYFPYWKKEEQRYELAQMSTLDIHPPHITPTELSERQEITIVQLSKDASVSIDPHGYVIIRSGEIRSVSFPSREAYALLEALYQHRDLLYQASQQDESDPAQKSELQQYAEKHPLQGAEQENNMKELQITKRWINQRCIGYQMDTTGRITCSVYQGEVELSDGTTKTAYFVGNSSWGYQPEPTSEKPRIDREQPQL